MYKQSSYPQGLLNATERMDIDCIEKSNTPNDIEYLLENMKISH